MDRNIDRLGAACRWRCAGQTSKDAYPNRPVRLIVPFGAGGPGDIFARLIGQKLSERLGQQFVMRDEPSRLDAPPKSLLQ